MDNNLHKRRRNHKSSSQTVVLPTPWTFFFFLLFDLIIFNFPLFILADPCIEKAVNFNKSWPFRAQLFECFQPLFILLKGAQKSPLPEVFVPYSQHQRNLHLGSKVVNKLEALLLTFIQVRLTSQCSVKDEQVTLWFIFSSSSPLWRTIAHYESPNCMFLHCHGFKEIGSLFVCGAASIQLPHKESGETRKGLRESSLCGVEAKGWVKKRERKEKKKEKKLPWCISFLWSRLQL